MSRGFSLWLDLIRALAAFAVLFGHMAHTRFTGGTYYFLRDINIASDAVVIFFVISGLVIAYAAGRDANLQTYAFNRLTRLFSVLIPALILTLVFDAIGTRAAIEAYPQGYYQALPVGEFLLRGLTFTNQWIGIWDHVRLGTNGPLWSLSYEVAYYLIFGVAVFLSGALRVALIALVALLAGVPVLALLPAWGLGVLVWHRLSNPTAPALPRAMAMIFAFGAPALIVLAKIYGIPQALTNVTAAVYAPGSHHVLGYSDEVLWNSLVAVLMALHLIGVKPLLENIAASGIISKTIRWIAGASFSLYVVHYPTLHLLDATLPENLPGYNLWLLVITLAVCFGFAALFERPLKLYRTLARRIFPARETPAIPAE